jgi:hypothetical protein
VGLGQDIAKVLAQRLLGPRPHPFPPHTLAGAPGAHRRPGGSPQ